MEYKSREECLEQVILLYQEKEELNEKIDNLKGVVNDLKGVLQNTKEKYNKIISDLEVELKVAKESKIVYVPYSQTPAWPQYPQNPIYPQGPIYNSPIITCSVLED